LSSWQQTIILMTEDDFAEDSLDRSVHPSSQNIPLLSHHFSPNRKSELKVLPISFNFHFLVFFFLILGKMKQIEVQFRK